MFVVIAPEKHICSESEIVTKLFEAGLEIFHLRKPNMSKMFLEHYLQKIPEQFHKRIVIDSFPELLEKYDLKGFHLKDKQREMICDINDFKANISKRKQTLSSSFHNIEDIINCEDFLDYYFLSPVFDSISKENYLGKELEVKNIDKKILALGGIKPENILKTKDLGYSGVAILGFIWNDEQPIERFKEIYKSYKNIYRIV
ncbi:thiamine phosphate synthase [Aureivirga marina]|uniref:thiamine phosphate synthase n=1 Tax=Aureivirga marina TaxID=1182451 RepID=UPI0018C96780|nr:thiamine phosphate synthase [Aureivirga marina]